MELYLCENSFKHSGNFLILASGIDTPLCLECGSIMRCINHGATLFVIDPGDIETVPLAAITPDMLRNEAR